jgi:hypothetical protein
MMVMLRPASVDPEASMVGAPSPALPPVKLLAPAPQGDDAPLDPAPLDDDVLLGSDPLWPELGESEMAPLLGPVDPPPTSELAASLEPGLASEEVSEVSGSVVRPPHQGSDTTDARIAADNVFTPRRE